MHNLREYPEYNNNPYIQELIKEGWEFYVSVEVHPHEGDEMISLMYRRPGAIWDSEWVNWGSWIPFTREEFDRRIQHLKAETVWNANYLKNRCIESLIENDFKSIHIVL